MIIFQQYSFQCISNDLETYFEVERINGVTIDFNADDITVYFKMYVMLYADDTIIVSDNAESNFVWTHFIHTV